MTQADLAGKADQQIESKNDNRVDCHPVCDIEVERVRKQQRQREQDQAENEQA
jgi:hypothetical protein